MLKRRVTVGVLALQGAFSEHIQLLRLASLDINSREKDDIDWHFEEVRTEGQLNLCDALIIPGGESTTMSLVAARSGLLEPLRSFAKVWRKPTWGTCAGLILLSESANRTKKGGQDLIGGLDVRVNRNHFGRQNESFQADIDLPFLKSDTDVDKPLQAYRGIFIRAPIVEMILPHKDGIQVEESRKDDTIVAPSRTPATPAASFQVESNIQVLARLPPKIAIDPTKETSASSSSEDGDIIAVKQGNVFGTSFHPELTGDSRIHRWWLRQVIAALHKRRECEEIPVRPNGPKSVDEHDSFKDKIHLDLT